MSDKKLVNLKVRLSPGLHAALKDRCDGKGNSLNATVCGLLERALLMDDLSRVARETIRQEMRAEFEARRDLEEQRHVLVALGFGPVVN